MVWASYQGALFQSLAGASYLLSLTAWKKFWSSQSCEYSYWLAINNCCCHPLEWIKCHLLDQPVLKSTGVSLRSLCFSKAQLADEFRFTCLKIVCPFLVTHFFWTPVFRKHWHSPTMVNFMCRLGWDTVSRYLVNHDSRCFCEGFFFWMRLAFFNVYYFSWHMLCSLQAHNTLIQ